MTKIQIPPGNLPQCAPWGNNIIIIITTDKLIFYMVVNCRGLSWILGSMSIPVGTVIFTHNNLDEEFT